ncbi:hypothetical protein GCG54_00014481 [Colletotrichum gloeosporioides]|uniref:Uncharacterized protein n=1 Tax=Colletotrichum gloeosporioides TaxID=474922 RepID=A0A8H4FRF2_COLGL|nr:uncharacterized protein GCG54_00014481 [Colletotrichum gloeosporioides]KAF3811730.1 hypothetical protein GCG54_00014481 [Colletotrichum gloeosporioides]
MPSPPCHALPYPAPDTSTPIPTNESRSLKSINPSSRPLFLLDMKIRVIAWKYSCPVPSCGNLVDVRLQTLYPPGSSSSNPLGSFQGEIILEHYDIPHRGDCRMCNLRIENAELRGEGWTLVDDSDLN